MTPTHRADVPVRTGTPSQVAHPWRATARTFVQTLVPAVIGLVVIAPEVLRILTEELVPAVEAVWPTVGAQLRLALAGAAVIVAALAAVATRLMALEGLEAWLKRWAPGLAALPAVEHHPAPVPDRQVLTEEEIHAEHLDVPGIDDP